MLKGFEIGYLAFKTFKVEVFEYFHRLGVKSEYVSYVHIFRDHTTPSQKEKGEVNRSLSPLLLK